MTCQIGYCAVAGAGDSCAGKVRLPWASLRYHQSKLDLACLLHGPAHRSFLSKRRLFRQPAGRGEAMCFSKMAKQHWWHLLSHPKTNWLKSAVRQLADGEVRCIRSTWAFSSWRLFSFFLFLFVPPAACHLLYCVIVSQSLSCSITHPHTQTTHQP